MKRAQEDCDHPPAGAGLLADRFVYGDESTIPDALGKSVADGCAKRLNGFDPDHAKPFLQVELGILSFVHADTNFRMLAPTHL